MIRVVHFLTMGELVDLWGRADARGALCVLAVVACGCSEPCEGFAAPLPAAWTEHADLVLPGGTVCRADRDAAMIDYDRAIVRGARYPLDPFAAHLRSRGWRATGRSDQEPVGGLGSEWRAELRRAQEMVTLDARLDLESSDYLHVELRYSRGE